MRYTSHSLTSYAISVKNITLPNSIVKNRYFDKLHLIFLLTYLKKCLYSSLCLLNLKEKNKKCFVIKLQRINKTGVCKIFGHFM